MTPHEVRIEREPSVFQAHICIVQIYVPRVREDAAAHAAGHHRVMVVRITSAQHQFRRLLKICVTLDIFAFCMESAEREHLHTCRVRQSFAVGRAPVPAFAHRYRGQCGQCEFVNAAVVVFSEESEVPVRSEFAAHNAPVAELQRAGGVDSGTVCLHFRLAESKVPGRVRLEVGDGVQYKVRLAVWCRLGVTACKTQLYGVDEFRGKDIAVETQTEPLHLAVRIIDLHLVVEGGSGQILHPEAERGLE